MKKLLQINVTANSGSTGRIAEGIARCAAARGFENLIAYGRTANASQFQTLRIGGRRDILWHGLETRLWDRHGLASRDATRTLCREIEHFAPDLVHLHNLHGYYLNYPILFHYLKESGVPVVWTLHDCWAFTGHCAHFVQANCFLWRTGCHAPCPNRRSYPGSLLADRCRRNWQDKLAAFTSLPNLNIVTCSDWLKNFVGESFLKGIPVQTIHNGIDLNTFRDRGEDPQKIRLRHRIPMDKKILFGCAGVWDPGKGLDDFIKLAEQLPADWQIVLAGVSEAQRRILPANATGILRTESAAELADLYAISSQFFNATYQDTYPTTNLESLACGTPVATYQTGGSVESIAPETGSFILEQGDVAGLLRHLAAWPGKNSAACRRYAEQYCDQDTCFEAYAQLYRLLTEKNKRCI